MIYLTDASRDNKTGVSSISFIDKGSDKTNNFQTNELKNIYEAELKGIKLCIVDAYEKYSNVVIFCDNKAAVNTARKELFHSMKLREKFRSVQFVWLPREFLDEVDFLTKNINDIDLNKDLKKSAFENQSKGNILDIVLNQNDYDKIIIDQYKSIDGIDSIELNSQIFVDLFYGKVTQDRQEIVNSKEFYNDIVLILKEYPELSKKGSKLQKLIEMLSVFQ